MKSRDRYYAALCQPDHANPRNRREMVKNTQSMLALMERAVVGYRPFHDVALVIFPEFAHAAPIYPTREELLEHLAIPAANEHIDKICRKARELGCYVQSGSFLEVDERWPDLVFNTTLLISAEGKVLSRYRKVNPWIPWEVHASPHDIEDYPDDPFPVVETAIGNLGVATCYDWLFPEVTRELTLKGAEVLVRISAYMDPWGTMEPLSWWTTVNRCRALENVAYVLACNQAASAENYPPFSWPGGSMACDFDGRILAQANPGAGEQVTVAPVDLAALRYERARRQGHAMPIHLRSEIYPEAKKPHFPRRQALKDLEVSALDTAIKRQKKKSSFGQNLLHDD